ncbi:MAG: hypothetical protein CVU13_02710 [Bacteroidetes bacterium HGW-Bacteroidetes-8]|jgi:hypothetical protein|nr:MAG: hypothetical protein CVU13_02710 [Bacteroidetes bacterium HGW-Bacteroidetes-8]
MRNFFKYSFFVSDLKLNIKDFQLKTGSGFEGEIDHLVNSYSTLEAIGGFVNIPADEINLDMGRRISGHFKKAETISIFVVTLGKGYVDLRDRYRGDPLLYYLSDLLASEYTEQAADSLHMKIAAYAESHSMKYSNRYSPGYCGWSTKDQGSLFSYLPPDPCGIKLTDSFLMTPVKSISGAVAIGSAVRFHKYDCNLCTDEKCLYREKYIL